MGGVCSLISFQLLWENLPTSGGGLTVLAGMYQRLRQHRKTGRGSPHTPPLLPHPQATLGEPGASVELVSQEEESGEGFTFPGGCQERGLGGWQGAEMSP